ncbi:RidA family protein [Nitrospirillum iridis]|uniref:Enamine deaminase RidA (YjgF/YER057c/UK114 family) n=1 Tax=Nitrospirillum iridis TaxID=765888 RepID=A0A7X0ECN2_9PROT|nr:RidA family protein [Nitrospirillum iridis]MBB6251833.1 enamine deaminase RidA (YjgF/YER057c/UK114 family) [Nitrospirillum iridis]
MSATTPPGSITGKVHALGLTLPQPSGPGGNYVSTTRIGPLLFVAGQIDPAAALGRLGDTVSVEDGARAARAAALNIIAHVVKAAGDDLAAVRRVAKLTVFVASTPDFTQQPLVANGASDLLVAVFGDAGRHARSAVGVAALPRGASVEVEAIVELSV